MSGLFIHQEPEGAFRVYAGLGAGPPTYDVGDIIELAGGMLVNNTDADGAEMTLAKAAGFAIEPAEGIHAHSRTGAANGMGAAQYQVRSYIPLSAPGLLMRTRNYWTATTTTQIAKPGTLVGTSLTIAHTTGVQGCEAEAPTAGTDTGGLVVAVLDDNMMPITAAATVAAGHGWIVFRPISA